MVITTHNSYEGGSVWLPIIPRREKLPYFHIHIPSFDFLCRLLLVASTVLSLLVTSWSPLTYSASQVLLLLVDSSPHSEDCQSLC